MFSVRQKRDIAHPELPEGEIQFELQVLGATNMSWAIIRNNGAVPNPDVNPHNEAQDPKSK